MSKLFAAGETNLSLTWLEVFLKLMERGVSELAPAVITISEFDRLGLPVEVSGFQTALDRANKQTCRTVGSTIFPYSLWSPGATAQLLYERYARIWPRVARCPANNKGVYFKRLIAYEPLLQNEEVEPVNQLAHVIETYSGGNHRHSALQAAIFDPTRDHTHNRQRGFPCLQQVAFNAESETGELSITGSYALQHHVAKAYGNYLGLCWLGRFMAAQMGLKLVQVTCIASSLKLGNGMSKADLVPLRDELLQLAEQHGMKAA